MSSAIVNTEEMQSYEEQNTSTNIVGSTTPRGSISSHNEEFEKVTKRQESTETDWKKDKLIVVVVGASGDLAKKKTFPSLLDLFSNRFLPCDVSIWGFARSKLTHDDLRNKLKPYLEKSGYHQPEIVEEFLSRCFYQRGKGYGDLESWGELGRKLSSIEDTFQEMKNNRLFYFAIPPNVFAETGIAIKKTSMADKGWSRMIVEKPFGRDLESCEALLKTLAGNFKEEQLYRIDHYLGKELVQNVLVMRFGNLWLEKIWDRNNIQCVFLTFKENFGTEGRGGYFDKYGIIRDIIQNHLMQLLTLLAMESPTKADGPGSGESIRDAKVQVLKAILPVTMDDCLLGQYEGYTDDPTIANKDSNTPTYAAICCYVNTPRWAGVPFILKAGKALHERKAEMRVQFKNAPAAEFLFGKECARNELVMRMQPDEAIYFKTNVKSPGFSSDPIQSELEVNYNTRYSEESNPDAYTRLILDVLRGRSAAFVREDELRKSWEIFTPLLQQIDNENKKPFTYKCDSRGPHEADAFIKNKSGYIRNEDYVFHNGKVVSKM